VEGRLIHALILDSKFEWDIAVRTALLDMYSKCANLEDAQSVFELTPRCDVVAWNAMIAAYAHHGQIKAALQVFYKMLLCCFVPDETTFVCVLTACSHGGMVYEADRWFHLMRVLHGILPSIDHCNCLLDMFGRCGLIDKGEHLVLNMPFQPSITSWMTVLSAHRTHLNVAGGEHAAGHAFEMVGEFAAPFVVLSNLYSVTGHLDAAESIRKMMKGNRLRNTHLMSEI
jgi:pentatricopeptide repeat protein